MPHRLDAIDAPLECPCVSRGEFRDCVRATQMNEFKSMRPPRVTVVRGGEVSFVDAALITIGDIVKLEQGDLVPADIRVLECSPNMCVDNSSLTGESDPIKRKPECTHSDPLETANLCFFGTQVPEGSCVGVVVKIADNTVRSPRVEVFM